METDALAARMDGLIHEETQIQHGRAHMTVESIAEVSSPGQLDFGGGEYREAGTDPLEPDLRSPEDEYGWRSLEPGAYRVRFNETFPAAEDVLAIIQPWEPAARNGVFHPTRVLSEPDPAVTIQVDTPVDIKENARLSELVVYRL